MCVKYHFSIMNYECIYVPYTEIFVLQKYVEPTSKYSKKSLKVKLVSDEYNK